MTGIPINTIVPGQPICTAVKELEDDLSKRVFMTTGRNPAGVSCEWLGTAQIGAVVNQGDGNVQMFDPGSLATVNSALLGTFTQPFTVGENPLDVAWTPLFTSPAHPPWIWAFIVNQGGQDDPQGSVSLWFNHSSLIGLFDSNTGIILTTYKDGVNVPGRPFSDPVASRVWIPNSAGDDIQRLEVNTAGNFIGVAFTMTLGEKRVIGSNPTKMTYTGDSSSNIMTAFASLAGEGQVAVFQVDGTVGNASYYKLPGVQYVFSAWDQ